MKKLAVALLVALIALGVAAPAQAETIHDVVSATWPAPLVSQAEQIKYHEGGPYFNDGYCGFGIIPSTAYIYGLNTYAMDPYSCSAAAYQIYLDAGWGAWTTYGWYTPGAEYTPIIY